MVEIFSLDGRPELLNPRRLMKYVLIWCRSGKIALKVDEGAFELCAGDVITITSGQIHAVTETEEATGYVLEFTLDFFCKDDHDMELIFHNGLFCHFALNEVIPTGSQSAIEAYLETIAKELREKPYQYLLSVHALIKQMLIAINRAKIDLGREVWKPDALFLKFLELVRNNFEKNLTVNQLAAQLGTTETQLNELAKFHAGKTAQNVIYGLVISEAKRLLTYEKMAVKEAAYRLGFSDPFYFSNFFKKHTRLSPKAYRQAFAL